MMVGYAPDAFGHIAHLPAILRGFGIDSVLIWRGVGDEATTSEFRWAAPDGSEVLAVHFPHGYGMLPALPEDRETLRGGAPEHARACSSRSRRRATCWCRTARTTCRRTPVFRASSGPANEVLDDAEVVHGSYPMYVENVRRELGETAIDSLPRLGGRVPVEPALERAAGGALVADVAEAALPGVRGLAGAVCGAAGCWRRVISSQQSVIREESGPPQSEESTRGLLRQAWKLLLQNGPHDSVTGCSVDAVYDDVGARFDRCQQIAESLIYDAQRYIAERAARPGEQTVVVFNSENGPRTDFCTIRLPVEEGKWPAKLVAEDGSGVAPPGDRAGRALATGRARAGDVRLRGAGGAGVWLSGDAGGVRGARRRGRNRALRTPTSPEIENDLLPRRRPIL